MPEKVSKGYKGLGMNGVIAAWYAKNTRKNMEDYRRVAKKAAQSLYTGASVLEVAPGPGYLSLELAKLGGCTVTGLDISETFVEIARKHAKEAGVEIDFRLGDAAAMPFPDETFDLIICRSAFKNFSQPIRALDEMHRVLKPGGKAVILDLRGDVSSARLNRHVEEELAYTGVNALLTKWVMRSMLIKRAYTKQAFAEMVSKSEFGSCEILEDSIELEIRLEKKLPSGALEAL